MFFKTLAATALLAGSALAEPMPYKVERVGMMSVNRAFGLARRQDGYQPTQTLCGNGADCAAACGPTYITCPSKDSQLHCYDPTNLKESCCPDGTGSKFPLPPCYIYHTNFLFRFLLRWILLHKRQLWSNVVLPQRTFPLTTTAHNPY
jgi:hypothetical protein